METAERGGDNLGRGTEVLPGVWDQAKGDAECRDKCQDQNPPVLDAPGNIFPVEKTPLYPAFLPLKGSRRRPLPDG